MHRQPSYIHRTSSRRFRTKQCLETNARFAMLKYGKSNDFRQFNRANIDQVRLGGKRLFLFSQDGEVVFESVEVRRLSGGR